VSYVLCVRIRCFLSWVQNGGLITFLVLPPKELFHYFMISRRQIKPYYHLFHYFISLCIVFDAPYYHLFVSEDLRHLRSDCLVSWWSKETKSVAQVLLFSLFIWSFKSRQTAAWKLQKCAKKKVTASALALSRQDVRSYTDAGNIAVRSIYVCDWLTT
jgi:hypothetical protein